MRRKEIKDIIAYLKFIIDDNDVMSFKRIVNEPARGLGVKTIQDLLALSKTYSLTIFDAIEAFKSISASKYKALSQFKNMIINFQNKLDQISLTELFEEILLQTDYLSIFEDDENYEERKENLMEFKSILKNIDEDGEIATNKEKLIYAFDEAILSDDKLQNQRQANDGVTLSTVHSVKGLEFDTVFVVAFEMGIFPSYFATTESDDGEEERRIAYVAVTRAKTQLYLTTAKKRLLYGQFNNNKPSQFLLEFTGANRFSKTKKENSIKIDNQVSKNEKDDNLDKNYHVGDYVIHKIYGEGIIVSLEGNNGKICFVERGEIKLFDITHSSIRKK